MATMNIEGQPGELRMSVQVKRAETGEVQEFELVGTLTDEEAEQLKRQLALNPEKGG